MKTVTVILMNRVIHSSDEPYLLSRQALAQMAKSAVGTKIRDPNHKEVGTIIKAWADDEVVWAEARIEE